MNPWSTNGGPDLLSDDAQKLESATGETLLRPSRACLRMSRSAGTELNLSLGKARRPNVAASCRLDVGDQHDGVAESTMSGERLCRMRDGRRDLASV
jgi:hypothetical protein